jgi:small subunit ribosomal protein S21
MLRIEVKKGKIDAALKAYKRKVRNTKQLQKQRDLKEYTKPSVKRRKQKMRAEYIQRMRDQHIE